MKYSKLGTTDIEVSKICLGTMTFGQQNTEAEGHEQMNYAFENGVNFFDRKKGQIEIRLFLQPKLLDLLE